MKVKLLFVFICFITISICGCSKEDMVSGKKYEMAKDIQVSFSDNQILVINSEGEFIKYFKEVNAKLPKEKQLASVNFKKCTLIYVQGMTPKGISEIKSFLTTDATPYVLSVNIKQNFSDVITRWNVAYLIDKQEHPNVKLQLNIEKDD